MHAANTTATRQPRSRARMFGLQAANGGSGQERELFALLMVTNDSPWPAERAQPRRNNDCPARLESLGLAVEHGARYGVQPRRLGFATFLSEPAIFDCFG